MNRTADSLSMLNPLADGDTVTLDTPEGAFEWTVGRGEYGWNLYRRHKGARILHPTINDIDGMAEFIGAILEYSKGYFCA